MDLHWLFSVLLYGLTLGVFNAFGRIYTRCFGDFGWIYTVCFYCFCIDLAVLLLYGFVAEKNTFVEGKPKFCNRRNLFVDENIKCCLRKNILVASRKFCKEILQIKVSFIVSFVVKKKSS